MEWLTIKKILLLTAACIDTISAVVLGLKVSELYSNIDNNTNGFIIFGLTLAFLSLKILIQFGIVLAPDKQITDEARKYKI